MIDFLYMKLYFNPMKLFMIPALFLLLTGQIPASQPAEQIMEIPVQGIINPVMESFILKRISEAEKKNRTAVLLVIDTPGGSLESTRTIVQKIINCSVPVIGYVSPESARAASAGAFIMLACDKAVMVSTAQIGAAHPVQASGKKIDETMEEKIVNDTAAWIRNLAKRNGRNQDTAALMVTDSLSLTSEEALQKGMIDWITPTTEELLNQLGKSFIYKQETKWSFEPSPSLFFRGMSILEKILMKIVHPNIAYIFLMLGIYGIIAEFSSPGIGFAGVFGGISLIIAFLGLSILSVDITGILLIILAAVLFILEIKIPSSGIIAIGAVISFLLGSLMLARNISLGGISIDPVLIISMTVFTSLFFLVIIGFAVRSQSKKVITGDKGMIGLTGSVLTDLNPSGFIRVHGEIWKAETIGDEKIEKDLSVEVIEIHGLVLKVKTKN